MSSNLWDKSLYRDKRITRIPVSAERLGKRVDLSCFYRVVFVGAEPRENTLRSVRMSKVSKAIRERIARSLIKRRVGDVPTIPLGHGDGPIMRAAKSKSAAPHLFDYMRGLQIMLDIHSDR